jgi:hypothetical protein
MRGELDRIPTFGAVSTAKSTGRVGVIKILKVVVEMSDWPGAVFRVKVKRCFRGWWNPLKARLSSLADGD